MKIGRRKAREITLCLVFDFGFNTDEKPEELLELYIKYFPDSDERKITESIKEDKYISDVYFGVTQKIPEIDEIIKDNSKNWKLERISRISISILRIATFEMLYMNDIPTEVSINEAVEMAKKYDTDDSYTFVNGVLGSISKRINEYKVQE